MVNILDGEIMFGYYMLKSRCWMFFIFLIIKLCFFIGVVVIFK